MVSQVRKSMSQFYPGSPESSVQSKAHSFIYFLPRILLKDLEYLSGLWFLPLAQWTWCWATSTVQWRIIKNMALLVDVLLASVKLAKASSILQWCWFCISTSHGEEQDWVEWGTPAGLSWTTSDMLGSAQRRWFVSSSFRIIDDMAGSNGFIQASYNTSVALFIQFSFS